MDENPINEVEVEVLEEKTVQEIVQEEPPKKRKPRSRKSASNSVSPVSHYQFDGQTLVVNSEGQYFLIPTNKLGGLKAGVQYAVNESDLKEANLERLIVILPSLGRLLD